MYFLNHTLAEHIRGVSRLDQRNDLADKVARVLDQDICYRFLKGEPVSLEPVIALASLSTSRPSRERF
jgi:hypothetical protein